MKLNERILAVLLALVFVLGFAPIARTALAANSSEIRERIDGNRFNGYTVSIRPAGSSSAICVKNNGHGSGQDPLHVFAHGDSFRFYLSKADSESYYIRFFDGADQQELSSKYVDLDDGGNYGKEGNVVHVVKGNTTAENKRWKFIQLNDGSYWIQNKKSGKYWTLKNTSNFDNGNKVCQSSTPMRFEIEIIETSANPILTPEIKAYDSFTFTSGDSAVTSVNWMTNIPDHISLADISIPGTHDSSTAHMSSSNNMAQCQNLSIKDQLNAGVRYFDLRFGKEKVDGVQKLKMVHGSTTAQYMGETLMFDTVVSWFRSFLNTNPGETIIIQVKQDQGGEETETLVYNYLKNRLSDLLYKGDHVPDMGEVRGKIVVLSRLEKYSNNDFRTAGGVQWALDVKNWKKGQGSGTSGKVFSALVAEGSNYEVWSQDDYDQSWSSKWTRVKYSVFDAEEGANARIADAAAKGKKALVVCYTSATKILMNQFPQDIARELNRNLKEFLNSWQNGNPGKKLGVICSDFSDEQLACMVYRNNFTGEFPPVPVTFVGPEGEAQILSSEDGYFEITPDLGTEWEGGWYVLLSDTKIYGRITLHGDAYIVLTDGNTFEAPNGIDVGEHSLTVFGQSGGTGKLEITAPNSDFAGIGGTGSVEINGGFIEATGGAFAPGIGGNYNMRKLLDGLTITINGGTVVSESGGQSAGLGGAYGENTGLIRINGGSVTANGASQGAGVGAAGVGVMEGVIINGGTVIANGGYGSAGVGGGDGTKNVLVSINGGTVTASGGYRGAGIGGGAECTGTVVISGGDITAHTSNDEGCGIGGGRNGSMTVLLTYESADTELRIEADSYDRCEVTLEKPFCTEDGSTVFVSGPVSDPSSLAQQAIKPVDYVEEPPAESITFVGRNGEEMTLTGDEGYTEITSDLGLSWDGGRYVLASDAKILGRVTLQGDADIFLLDGFTLEVLNGIEVGEHTLTVWGQSGGSGELIITSPLSGMAGIGGTGHVEINGGRIEAKGGAFAPGIGGNYDMHRLLDGLTVTINGGTVVSSSGGQSAGLGGAYDENVGLITINGGSVTATGASQCAGIGAGGSRGAMEGIVINGGEISAAGGYGGAGVGGGDGTKNVSVRINGGSVNALGGYGGAGVGGGRECTGSLIIAGGKINALSDSDGFGIGGGKNGSMTVVLTYENEDSDMRIAAESYGCCELTLERPFMAEDGSVSFAEGQVSDLSALAEHAIRPFFERTAPAPSETGSVFGGGAAGFAIGAACVLVGFAGGLAAGAVRKGGKEGSAEASGDSE